MEIAAQPQPPPIAEFHQAVLASSSIEYAHLPVVITTEPQTLTTATSIIAAPSSLLDTATPTELATPLVPSYGDNLSPDVSLGDGMYIMFDCNDDNILIAGSQETLEVPFIGDTFPSVNLSQSQEGDQEQLLGEHQEPVHEPLENASPPFTPETTSEASPTQSIIQLPGHKGILVVKCR